MILQRSLTSPRQRRSAFTLLEVLVVVAIILVLASVATVAVLQVMQDNKPDMAKINANNLATVLKTYMVKNDGNPPQSIEDLLRYVDGNDPNKLLDPWGNQYQIGEQDNGDGVFSYYIYTTAPDGTVIRSDVKHKL